MRAVAVWCLVGSVVWGLAACGSSSPSHGASSEPRDSTSARPAPVQTARQVCEIEINVGGDIIYNAGLGNPNGLMEAIGLNNPQFAMDEAIAGKLNSYTIAYGQSEAENKVGADVESVCSSDTPPILTEGQVASLEQLATGTDATGLQSITKFAPG